MSSQVCLLGSEAQAEAVMSVVRAGEDLAVQELKESLEGLAKHLFGDVECRCRSAAGRDKF